MNNYIDSAIGLFNGQTQGGAIVLAVAAFVLGMIVMCLLCKICCPCGKNKKCQSSSGASKISKAKSANAEERPFEKRKPHPAPADGSIEIYVGNLSYEMTDNQLRKEFEAYGTVNSARLIVNKFSGKSKGFGFVQMPNRAEAEAAIAALNDKEIQGRKMKCNEAKNTI